MSGSEVEETYIGIVGGGPCGLVLALECAIRNVPFILYEQNLETSSHPKTLTTNARSMELLRRFKITKLIREYALPVGYPTDIIYRTQMLGGIELARIPLLLKCQWNTPEPQCQVTQKSLEKVIMQTLGSLGVGKNVRFGVEVENIEEHDHYVLVKLVGGEKIKCKYIVGCDGSRSLVRRVLGYSLFGEQSDTQEKGVFLQGHMLGIQFCCTGLRPACELQGTKIGWMHWIFTSKIRGVLLALDAKEHYMLHVKPDPGVELTKEYCKNLAQAAIGENLSVEILSFETWRCGHALVAENYNSERCYLAGDAIHLFTPTGAYGMNTGIADVCDLGWKFGAIYHGWGDHSILRSYIIERRPVALYNAQCAINGSKLISSNSSMIVEWIQSSNSQNIEDISKRIYSSNPNPYHHTPQLGYIYSESPIIINPFGELRSDKPILVPGARLPHCWLNGGDDSIYDMIDINYYTLLRVSVHDFVELIDVILEKCKSMTLPVKILDIDCNDIYTTPLALMIRPDLHIVWIIDKNVNLAEIENCIYMIKGKI